MKPFIAFLGLVLVATAACGPMGKLEDGNIPSQLTGGTDSKTQRPFTQTTDGRDSSFNMAQDIPKNREAANQIDNIELETVTPPHTIKINLKNTPEPIRFAGNFPKSPGQKEIWTTKSSGSAKLSLSCAENCSSYVGIMQSQNNSVGFTLRNIDAAKAKILFLQPSEAFKIRSTYDTSFPALTNFILDFQSSKVVQAQSYEVSLGKSAIRLQLSWGYGYTLCLQTPATTTDLSQKALSQTEVTCGENQLPNTKIFLVGNNQSGKIALRFIIDDNFAFLLFVDLNGNDLPNNQANDNPKLLLPDSAGKSNAVFKTNLAKPRSLLTMQQIYRDFPDNSELEELPEQKYGKKIIKNWVEKWQGSNAEVSTCFEKVTTDWQFKSNYARFVKVAPPRFTKVAKIFDDQDVPSNFMFTTLIESPQFYNNPSRIEVSSAGAVGPWQLMESAAKDFGLITYPLVNNNADSRDERGDLAKSTKAAVSYFKKLLGYFGDSDYKLAMAAYNQGPGGLFSNIRNTVTTEKYDSYYASTFASASNPGKPDNYKERINNNNLSMPKNSDKWQDIAKDWSYKIPSYWFLHEFHMMPCQTRDYVPKLVSAIVIGENPKAHGF